MKADNTQLDRFDKKDEVRLAEEEEWVQRASQGDQDAFIRLYGRYFDSVYRYFSARVGGVSKAERLTTETFTQAVEALLRGHATWHDRPFGAWLYDIASNVLQEQNRALEDILFDENSSHGREFSTSVHQERNDVDIGIGEEEGEVLWQLVYALQAMEQRILIMRHVQKLSYTEIAKRLKLSESACKRLHYRVLKKLKLLTQKTDLWSKIARAMFESEQETP